jgi:hypothetical protein
MTYEPTPMHQLLLDCGFADGWAMTEEKLILWEHEEDPPAPLVRPQTDEPVAEEPVDEPSEGEQP